MSAGAAVAAVAAVDSKCAPERYVAAPGLENVQVCPVNLWQAEDTGNGSHDVGEEAPVIRDKWQYSVGTEREAVVDGTEEHASPVAV